MIPSERPLSPHIQIYRWRHTFFSASVWNRGTGIALAAGIPFLVYWLYAAAEGKLVYDQAMGYLSSPLAKIAMFGWVFSFYFHLLNGIRHLAWDLGYGFERPVTRSSGILVIVATLALTLGTWWYLSTRLAIT